MYGNPRAPLPYQSGLSTTFVVLIAAASFCIGVVLVGALWWIHDSYGQSNGERWRALLTLALRSRSEKDAAPLLPPQSGRFHVDGQLDVRLAETAA